MASAIDNAALLAEALRKSKPNDIGEIRVNKNNREPSATLKRLVIGRLQDVYPQLRRSARPNGGDDFGQDRFTAFDGIAGPSLALRATAKKGDPNAWTNTSREQIDHYSEDGVILLMLLWTDELIWAFCIPPTLPGLREAMRIGDKDVSLRVGPDARGKVLVKAGGTKLLLDDQYVSKISLISWELDRLKSAITGGAEGTENDGEEEDEIHEEAEKLVKASERKLVSRIARPEQAKFKRALQSWYSSSCQISCSNLSCIVQACHIDPKSLNGSSDKAENGLLLRADIHILYDANLIGVTPDKFVVVINKHVLTGTDYARFDEYEIFADAQHARRPNAVRMQRRWREFQATLKRFDELAAKKVLSV